MVTARESAWSPGQLCTYGWHHDFGEVQFVRLFCAPTSSDRFDAAQCVLSNGSFIRMRAPDGVSAVVADGDETLT